jgi:hypothetical protein
VCFRCICWVCMKEMQPRGVTGSGPARAVTKPPGHVGLKIGGPGGIGSARWQMGVLSGAPNGPH